MFFFKKIVIFFRIVVQIIMSVSPIITLTIGIGCPLVRFWIGWCRGDRIDGFGSITIISPGVVALLLVEVVVLLLVEVVVSLVLGW